MRLRNSSVTAVFPLSASLLLVLGACGSSDGDDGAQDSTSPSSEDEGTEDDATATDAEATADEAEGTGSEEAEDTSVDEAEGTGSDETAEDTGTDESGESGDESGTDDGTDTGADLEPSLEFLDFSRPIDITPDGAVALLENPAEIVDAYFYDTVTGEITFAATVGDPAADFSTGIANDLRFTALHGVPGQAGRWSPEGGWLDLPSPYAMGCDDVGGAWDISVDGTAVVGMMWDGCIPNAFRWIDDGGAGSLEILEIVGTGIDGGPPVNRASVVSADGQLVAGFAQNGNLVSRAATVWLADGTGIMLDPSEEWPNEIYSISADGHMVGGGRGYDGFYWTEAEGIVSLGKLPEAETTTKTFANAIVKNGDLIVGGVGDPWQVVPTAFVWTHAEGMRALAPIVEANGLDVPDGYTLFNVVAASEDGSVIVGTAFDPQNYVKTFVLRLDPAAYGL
jgi:hypothetical protein